VLTLPIVLRNAIAHGKALEPEADRDWWKAIADALTVPLATRASGVAQVLSGPPVHWPARWFFVAGDDVWSFIGIDGEAALYAARSGSVRHAPERTPVLLLAFQRLLDKSGVRERDFRRILARLAPEDMKGALLGDYLVGRPVGARDSRRCTWEGNSPPAERLP
jgi:hypothetical protein